MVNTLRLLPLAWLAVAVCTSTAAGESITVETTADADAADGLCSLREAILAANSDTAVNECPAGEGVDHIAFALPVPAVLVLSDHLPAITQELSIHGPGADLLTLDGDGTFRPLTIDAPPGTFVAVLDLTLLGGHTPAGDFGGGGALIQSGASTLFERVHFLGNSSANAGGGLRIDSEAGLESEATLVECLFEGNRADGPAGGGAVANTGTGSSVHVLRSTFVDNHAPDGSGGALRTSGGFATIEASTISGNSSETSGGGISAASLTAGPSSLFVRDTTITQNTAGTGGVSGDGGGLHLGQSTLHPMTVSLENSIVAQNLDATGSDLPDLYCNGALLTFSATGSSLIGANGSCDFAFPVGAPNANGDFVGTIGALLDPLLGPLDSFGGPTPTHIPQFLPGSPLIDQGSCPGVAADQRRHGAPGTGLRPHDHPAVTNAAGGDGCDIGAHEYEAEAIAPGEIFADGFEHGHTLRWSSELP